MSGSATAECALPAEPVAVGRARRAVRAALEETGGTHLQDAAEIVVSELVTNALVHAGTGVSLRIVAGPDAIRVEICDGSPHVPVRRRWPQTAGTGRGLMIVDDYADRWGTSPTREGKMVWFEIGQVPAAVVVDDHLPIEEPAMVTVTLLDVPLLMQWAWQEHASSLLREFLLFALDDDVDVLVQHAAASDALALLHEQLPVPELPTTPEVLMASLVEPDVTAPEVCLRLPESSISNFEVLDALLARAVEAARSGLLLGAPTQPEIAEMRAWLCGEVARQAQHLEPVSWRAGTDVHSSRAVSSGWAALRAGLADSDDAVVATDEAGVIVAVSASAAELLGYRDQAELIGRRVLVVIPDRYHQAHIAGATLHATNGRDVLLDRWVSVPLLRADGSELPVEMRVETRRLEPDLYFFAAHLRVEEPSPEGVTT